MVVWTGFQLQPGGDTSSNAKISRAAQSLLSWDRPTLERSAKDAHPMKQTTSGIFFVMW